MVKSDEAHDLVVVVPGGSGSARTFWTGSGEEGRSPLVCRQVREIAARGRTLLPLSATDREMLQSALVRFPPGLPRECLYVTGPAGGRRQEVLVWTFCGSSFNRILACLLEKKLGSRAQVRYTDFLVRIGRAGREGGTERVLAALEAIRRMEPSRAAAALPLPPEENWKFARILPAALFRQLAAADYYNLDGFRTALAGFDVVAGPAFSPPAATPGNTPE
jgi:hypothetical protein